MIFIYSVVIFLFDFFIALCQWFYIYNSVWLQKSTPGSKFSYFQIICNYRWDLCWCPVFH